MDYSKTLNLPQINLPVKADFAKTEPEILNIWKDRSVYEKRQRLNKEKSTSLIHSPLSPAHGISIDDAVNVILTDVMVKYKLMCGFRVSHFPVWNCYTSAIEQEVLQLLESKRNEVEQAEVWKRCQSLCSEYVDFQKEQLQRLGVFAYWDKAVLTSDSKYKSRVIEAFGNLYEAGYIYKGTKPTRWCINCQTDLAEPEIEYRNYKLLSLHVKFPVIRELEELGEDVYILVRINTPWTLPANTAITVHPDIDYAAVETENNGILIMADSVVEDIIGKKANENYSIIKKMKGLELYKTVCAHPFLYRDCDVLLDRHVSSIRGTGCDHAMPRADQGDYSTGQQPELETISTVDQNGRLTEEAGRFCGLNVFEASDPITMELEKRECLLLSESVEQQYPHCPYCQKPIVVRSADKWIVKLNANNLHQRVLNVVEESNWIPHWNKNRAAYAIAKRSDWGISRRRIWGIPVPVFYCSKCDLQIDTLESIKASRTMINKRGVSRWLKANPSDILADDLVCSRCGGKDFRWERDILDADFISAMSYKAILPNNKDTFQAAEICLGSNGQNEQWPQLSLLTAMAIEGSAPFESVLLRESVVDDEGTGASRSENDKLLVQDLLDRFGADILRFWAVSVDCGKHLKVSLPRIESVSNAYLRIRNICRFLLGNLYDYDPDGDRVEYAYLQEIDHWLLHRLTRFINGVTKALERCQFHLFYHLLYDFCSVDISSRYFSIAKRRLYASSRWSSSRRAVQTVMYEVLASLAKVMAPVLPFTAEDIWRHIPGGKEDCHSVYLLHWPEENKNFLNNELESRWDHLLKIRSEIYKTLEAVRQKEGINGSSQASITLYASSSDVHALLDRYIDDLETIFAVSKVRLMPPDTIVPDEVWKSNRLEGLAIEIRRTTGEKCERCWIYSDTVGTNDQYPTLCYQCIATLEGGTYYI